MKIQTVVKYRIKKVKSRDELEYKDALNNTKAESVSSNNITEVLAKQRDNITKQINNSIDSWQVDRFIYVIISCYTVKPPRASSYIPTPEPYNNPKCGLVNIKNNDNNCFSWCMKYHQTNQVKNDDRISVLNKVEDKYNYDNVNMPASYDDVKIFEDNNKVCVNIYVIGEHDTIILDYMGNIEHIKNNIIYLLRIEYEDQSHYVYVKHIQRLLNLNSYTKPDVCKEFCPNCNTKYQFYRFLQQSS